MRDYIARLAFVSTTLVASDIFGTVPVMIVLVALVVIVLAIVGAIDLWDAR